MKTKTNPITQQYKKNVAVFYFVYVLRRHTVRRRSFHFCKICFAFYAFRSVQVSWLHVFHKKNFFVSLPQFIFMGKVTRTRKTWLQIFIPNLSTDNKPHNSQVQFFVYILILERKVSMSNRSINTHHMLHIEVFSSFDQLPIFGIETDISVAQMTIYVLSSKIER